MKHPSCHLSALCHAIFGNQKSQRKNSMKTKCRRTCKQSEPAGTFQTPLKNQTDTSKTKQWRRRLSLLGDLPCTNPEARQTNRLVALKLSSLRLEYLSTWEAEVHASGWKVGASGSSVIYATLEASSCASGRSTWLPGSLGNRFPKHFLPRLMCNWRWQRLQQDYKSWASARRLTAKERNFSIFSE